MSELIITIFSIGVLSNLFTHWFEPIQPAKEWFIYLFSGVKVVHNSLDTLLNCPKCFAFWFSLIYFQNIFWASLAGFFGFIVQFFINYIDDYYRR